MVQRATIFTDDKFLWIHQDEYQIDNNIYRGNFNETYSLYIITSRVGFELEMRPGLDYMLNGLPQNKKASPN